MMKSKFPEHAKLRALDGKNQVVGDFIEWLRAEGYAIRRLEHGEYWPVSATTEKLIADFFGLDRDKLEAEKQAMLEQIRRGK